MKEKQRDCWNCTHRRGSFGDCHIGCANPPKAVVLVGSGGAERVKIAQKLVEVALKEKKIPLAVRCVWPKSGVFPSLYDGNTVFACGNFEEGEPPIKKTSQFERITETFENGVPPVIGQLKIKS